MKTIPIESRIQNVTSRPRERCRWCDNTGYVVYDSGDPIDEEWIKQVRRMSLEERQKNGLHRTPYAEMMAPCPYCERGFFEEFPREGKDSNIRSPWGEEGFWLDKPDVELVPVRTATLPLPIEENRRRLAELAARFGVIAKDVEPENVDDIDPDDDLPF